MKTKWEVIVNAGDSVAGFTSAAVDIRYQYGFATVATFTGTPAGSVLIEGTIDGTTWVQLDTQAISGTTAQTKNLDAQYYQYVRVRKVGAAGVGTVTVTISTKGP